MSFLYLNTKSPQIYNFFFIYTSVRAILFKKVHILVNFVFYLLPFVFFFVPLQTRYVRKTINKYDRNS